MQPDSFLLGRLHPFLLGQLLWAFHGKLFGHVCSIGSFNSILFSGQVGLVISSMYTCIHVHMVAHAGFRCVQNAFYFGNNLTSTFVVGEEEYTFGYRDEANNNEQVCHVHVYINWHFEAHTCVRLCTCCARILTCKYMCMLKKIRMRVRKRMPASMLLRTMRMCGFTCMFTASALMRSNA
jgi:hypothetical protein